MIFLKKGENSMKTGMKRKRLFFGLIPGMIFFLASSHPYAAQPPRGDRAMEITRQVKEDVSRSGNQLVSNAKSFFKEFAAKTKDLQNIIDTRKALKNAGMMDEEAVRANINARFLTTVGELKQSSDRHLAQMLRSFEDFEETIARAVIDTQNVKAINSNYELALQQYRESGKKKYDQAERDALEELKKCRKDDKHACNRYKIKKDGLRRIGQNIRMLEGRARIAEINQKLSVATREMIKNKGPSIAQTFRRTIGKLYEVFLKISHVVAMGGTDIRRILEGEKFGLPFGEMEKTLDTMLASVEKLDTEIEGIVNDVLGSLGSIQPLSEGGDLEIEQGAQLVVEEEMESLRKMRQELFGS